MNIANKRNYRQRLLEDINKFGTEYVLRIISIKDLQKHYMCRDWKENKLYSAKRVVRMHGYDRYFNFYRRCGCKTGE